MTIIESPFLSSNAVMTAMTIITIITIMTLISISVGLVYAFALLSYAQQSGVQRRRPLHHPEHSSGQSGGFTLHSLYVPPVSAVARDGQ